MNMEVFLVEEAEVNPNNSCCKTEECLVTFETNRNRKLFSRASRVCAYFGICYHLSQPNRANPFSTALAFYNLC